MTTGSRVLVVVVVAVMREPGTVKGVGVLSYWRLTAAAAVLAVLTA